VIDLDATLDKQFLHIAIGRAVTQVPPHREHDDFAQKPESREG
jgi:hypothetical protein